MSIDQNCIFSLNGLNNKMRHNWAGEYLPFLFFLFWSVFTDSKNKLSENL